MFLLFLGSENFGEKSFASSKKHLRKNFVEKNF